MTPEKSSSRLYLRAACRPKNFRAECGEGLFLYARRFPRRLGERSSCLSFRRPPFVSALKHFPNRLHDHFAWCGAFGVRLRLDLLPEFSREARSLFSARRCHAVHHFILVHFYQ